MTLFESAKAVALRRAAEAYGLRVGRSDMCCCPFHADKHPSMKLNDDYFYCFGCHASGDVIDLTAKLLGLTKAEAARRLTQDFGANASVPVKPRQSTERHALQVLNEYLNTLESWKEQFAPQQPDAPMDDRFSDACQMIPYVRYLVDLLSFGMPEEKATAMRILQRENVIEGLQRILDRHRQEVQANDECTSTADL